MSRSSSLLRLFDEYEQAHRHPLNRLCHAVGIPTILLALAVLPAKPVSGALLMALGWALQFLGHAVEGRRPSFTRNPAFLAVGPLYFGYKLYTWFTRRLAPR